MGYALSYAITQSSSASLQKAKLPRESSSKLQKLGLVSGLFRISYSKCDFGFCYSIGALRQPFLQSLSQFSFLLVPFYSFLC